MQPLLVRVAAIPMFSMAMPRSQPVAIRRPGHLNYPPSERSASIEGVIVLQFIVDSTGHVVYKSIKDTWPTNRPRLTGVSGAHYDAFLNAARLAASEARYDPAKVGGCPVKQVVEQPFTFSLAR